MKPDAVLLIDPGSSVGKYLLWRAPDTKISHHLPASCVPITQEEYLEDISTHQWGAGVVQVPTESGLKYFRVGEDNISRTAPDVMKWESCLAKILCALGHVAETSDSELKISLHALLPVDENVYRLPLFQAIKYAMLNGAEVNGVSLKPIKIINPSCLPEGSGLIEDRVKPSAALLCGHCDISFVIGKAAVVDVVDSFTMAGCGAILPLKLSELPTFGSEVDAAAAISNRKWSYFTQDGLTLSQVQSQAEIALESYPEKLSQNLDAVVKACRKSKIEKITVAGGSAPLMLPFLKKALDLQIVRTKDVEQKLTTELSLAKSLAPRFVDAYSVWGRVIPHV
jgi:hypothetical protein